MYIYVYAVLMVWYVLYALQIQWQSLELTMQAAPFRQGSGLQSSISMPQLVPVNPALQEHS